MNNNSFDILAPKFTEKDLEGSITQRFEQIAALVPDSLAVVKGASSFTYGELNKASNRVANHLLQRADTINRPVSILMDNDLTVFAAMLGVLKAGATYCVLNPSFPTIRNTFILDDLQSDLLLTDNSNLNQAKHLAGETCQIINVETLSSNGSPSNFEIEIAPNNLAAIYYTTGTTGKPKGIERTHAHILHKSIIVEANFPAHVGSVVSLLYACCYGASLQDIYPTLLSGATIAVSDVRQADPEKLANWLVDQQVSHLHLHASILRFLLDFLPENAFFPNLLYLQPVQRLYRRDVTRIWRHLPQHAVVIHRLAATETGTITLLKMNRSDVLDGDVVPVGYPVPGVEVFLADEKGRKVDDGEVGEIVARGKYLPHRYWRRPHLTAERFQVDPTDNRYRIVKLGDLGRFRPEGYLELLGRKDNMVKIRGHRVELDEVESRLDQLPHVQRSSATVHSDTIGEPMLVAYVQPKESMKIEIGSLRSQLKQVLPDAMIPSRFMLIDKLPTYPNGKVDRAKLPPPDLGRPEIDTPFVAPRTPTEAEVAAIWVDVLGLDQVGIHDNFLDLGGHSLLAGRIISRVLREFLVDLPISQLFESPTVADMALVITQQQAGKLDKRTLQRLLSELEEPANHMQNDGP